MKRSLKRMSLDQLRETMPVLSEAEAREVIGGSGYYSSVTGSVPAPYDCVLGCISFLTGTSKGAILDKYASYLEKSRGMDFEESYIHIRKHGVQTCDMDWVISQYSFVPGYASYESGNSYGLTGNSSMQDMGMAILPTGNGEGHAVVVTGYDHVRGIFHYYDPQRKITGEGVMSQTMGAYNYRGGFRI